MKVKEESEKVGLKLNLQKTKIMASGPITSCQIDGETMETVTDLIFLGSRRWWLQPQNEKMLVPWKKSYDKPRQHINKQRHYFANKDPSHQRYGFSSSHVWMWELGHKEGWAPKNWCFQTVVLGKTLWESFGLQGDQTSQSKRKSTLNVHWKDWCWSWSSNTMANWCEELNHWKRPWCLERVKAGGEGDDRG